MDTVTSDADATLAERWAKIGIRLNRLAIENQMEGDPQLVVVTELIRGGVDTYTSEAYLFDKTPSTRVPGRSPEFIPGTASILSAEAAREIPGPPRWRDVNLAKVIIHDPKTRKRIE